MFFEINPATWTITAYADDGKVDVDNEFNGMNYDRWSTLWLSRCNNYGRQDKTELLLDYDNVPTSAAHGQATMPAHNHQNRDQEGPVRIKKTRIMGDSLTTVRAEAIFHKSDGTTYGYPSRRIAYTLDRTGS